MAFNFSNTMFFDTVKTKTTNAWVDSLSVPALKKFLEKKGYPSYALMTPKGIQQTLDAFKSGIKPDQFGSFTGDSGRGHPRGGRIADRVFEITGQTQAPRSGGVPSIDEIMGLLSGAAGQQQVPTIDLPSAPDYNALLKGMKPPKINIKKLKQQIRSSYKPLIQSLRKQRKAGELQSEQNLADIEGWYNQVETTAAEGRERNIEAANAAKTTLDNSVQAFLGAIGGGASPAAADIAKAGIASAGGLAAISQAQAGFDNRLAGLIGAAEVDSMRAEKNRASQQALETTLQMLQLKGERRSTILEAVMGAKQQNYQNKLQFIQMKAGFAEQSFQNALALAQIKFEAEAAFAQASDPAALIQSAIDIQYGIIRNLQMQRKDKKSTFDRTMEILEVQGKKLDNIKKTMDISGTGGVSQTEARGINNALEDAIGLGKPNSVTNPTAVVRIVVSTIRQLGLDPYMGEGRRIRLAFLQRFFRLGPTGLPISEFGDIGA